MSVLVTGGAGYIGSHAVQRLLRDGARVVVVDNLYRGHAGAIERLRATVDDPGRLVFQRGDIADGAMVEGLIREHRVTTVMHFAALTYVGESMGMPSAYYRNNTGSSVALLEACERSWGHAHGGVRRFVFSSTAATYGQPPADRVPIREDCPQEPINPYGASKLFVERVLRDAVVAAKGKGQEFSAACLRYFNVAGSDRSGVIGEDHDPETHLVPIALQAVMGIRPALSIFGTDYPTPDGTCVRDYVHVEDLVDAHVAVMDALKPGDFRTYNLGIGRGYSVNEVVEAVGRVTGRAVKVEVGARRAGDPPVLYADPSKVREELGWTARITELDQIIATAWDWMRKNPKGYQDGGS